jgi:asparagine synthase (glutamine-hydrolysing)
MFRYIGFIPERGRTDLQARLRHLSQLLSSSNGGWRCVVDQRDLQLHCAGITPGSSRVYGLARDAGAAVGVVFRRAGGNSTNLVNFSEADSEGIVTSRGQHLLTHFWGSYIAFVRDPHHHRCWVMKDPMGHLPCYRLSLDGLSILFSCFSDLASLRLPHPAINWDFVAARITAGYGTAGHTALAGVTELQGGEQIEFGAHDTTRRTVWNPADIASSGRIDDAQTAAQKLHHTVSDCTHALASRHENILHCLSGGLDSSIVMSCLATTPSRPDVTGVTYYLPGSPTDQRPYARAMAAQVQCRHLERARDPSQIRFARLLDAPESVKPLSGSYTCLEFAQGEQELAREYSATAWCTGDGGDSFFGSFSRGKMVMDFVHDHGLGRDLFSTAWALASNLNVSIWKVLGDALRYRRTGQARDEIIDNPLGARKLLSPALVNAASSRHNQSHLRHMDAGRHIPPGLRRMLIAAAVRSDFYDPLSRPEDPGTETLFPLRAQPVVELALRIPSYLLNEAGKDRELARRAFISDAPQMILRRRWKDRSAGQLEMTFKANVDFFREILLDGVLVREGYLDSARLTASLSGSPTRDSAGILEIADHALTESWLRVTLNERHRMAA